MNCLPNIAATASKTGPSDTDIGITIARVIFEPASERPSFLSAAELFDKGHYPEVLRHEPMVPGIAGLVSFLQGGGGLAGLARRTDYRCAGISEGIVYRTQQGDLSLASLTRDQGLSRNLLDVVRNTPALRPAPISLGVLSGMAANSAKAHEIASQVAQVLRSWRCSIEFSDLESGDGIERFLALNNGSTPVVLVPLEGRRGERPPDPVMKWLKYLTTERAPFQLCSTASDPRYSRHGLAMAIIAKAGGIHFATEPANGDLFRKSWFIGLDLGRGAQTESRVAVMSLTNAEGRLCAYWRAIKDTSESLSLETLQAGLAWLVQEAEIQQTGLHFVLMRDGRRPRDEGLDRYVSAMRGKPFTLIELAKQGSPLIHRNPSEPHPGSLIIPADSPFTALYPCLAPQHGVLAASVKFSVPINPLALTPEEVGGFLTALCHAPTLSFQPASAPAPIQWANGLAKLSFADLQFAGWSHLPNHTTDHRK